MNDDLRRLVRLQEIMVAAETLAERLAAVPAEVARLEKDLLAAQEKIDAERARVSDMQKERRRLEMELMGVETRIAKYQGQLAEVKTNKEYQAMLHEIEACRAERAAFDEKILIEMESSDRHQAELRRLEGGLEEKRRATTEGKVRLDEFAAGVRRQMEALEAERRETAALVSARYLDPFMKVARQRKGVALVAVREELCGGCHVRVMPKLIQQVRRAEGLIACDSCKRFLYVVDDQARVVPADGDVRS